MKKLTGLLSIFLIIFFTGCIKNEPITNSASKVEFDAATWNANSAGFSYPIMTLVPIFGAATPSTGTTISRSLATFRVRVNLLGIQKAAATSFEYNIVAAESTAIAGVHYAALSGTGTIPANSSFGYIDIQLINPGVSSATPVTLVLQLQSNAIVEANVNYAKVGFRISQL